MSKLFTMVLWVITKVFRKQFNSYIAAIEVNADNKGFSDGFRAGYDEGFISGRRYERRVTNAQFAMKA